MPEGLIVKALSGYYYVKPLNQTDGNELVQCRGRGILKKRLISPLVGDRVTYSLTENGEGMVDEIAARSNELVRPPVANVDLAVLVFAMTEPSLSLILLDKFLVHVEHAGLNAIIVLTKRDLIVALDGKKGEAEAELLRLPEMYTTIGYPVFVTSAKDDTGISLIRERLTDTISVLAGQSGVGKSSLLNVLVPELKLETAAISMKLGRGKHTTRHVELIALPNGGLVADTPGFSQLDFEGLEAEQLSNCFREFKNLTDNCKFRGCLHQSEPSCAVLEALEQGRIEQSRYDNYSQFLQEIKDKKRRY